MRAVIICGFMATGKTTVGRILAERLGTAFADADDVIERRTGMPVAEIFARRGEEAFRAVERQVCRELAVAGGVVAVGGGAVVDPADRAALARRALLVCLDAEPASLAPRLDGASGRPLADGGVWRNVLTARVPAYDAIALHVPTDGLSPSEVAEHIARRLSSPEGQVRRLPVPSPDGEYGVLVGAGLLPRAGALLREQGLRPGQSVVVSDETVAAVHAPSLLDALAAAGWDASLVEVRPGEEAKSPDELERLWDAFVDGGLGRDGLVLGLGGGVVGDLAGFAAATYLRGVAYVAVPTTLLAMVDAAIGGKTGVNLAAGKNLVGTFTSPRLVLADVDTLATLPGAEWRAGMAEVVKHALIEGGELLERLETAPPATLPGSTATGEPGVRAGADRSAAADPLDVTDLVARAAAVKVAVVADDFREQGRREVLNLGHTFAHGFEHASGYGIRHGDAVAVGLVAACLTSSEMGLAEAGLTERVASLLRVLGLPTTLDLDPDAALAAMAKDKKRRAGRLRLVLPERPGSVEVRPSPDETVLRRVLGQVLGAAGRPNG